MKRILSCMLAVVLLCTMLPMMAVAEDEQVTLRIAWWGSQTRHDLTMKLIDKFMEKNPDIKLEVEYADFGGHFSKLATQVAGGMTPDIIQMDYSYLDQYARNGVLEPLDAYIEASTLDMSKVSDAVLASGSVNGQVYAISAGTNVPVLMYRKDLVEQAGITEVPMEPAYEEYVAMSKAVYEATGQKDLIMSSGDTSLFNFRLRCFGLNTYAADGRSLGFDDPAYLVEMWENIETAQNEGYGLRADETITDNELDSITNEVWARFAHSNQLKAFEEGTGFDIGMMAIPSMAGATTPLTYLKPSMFWCVSSTCEYKDAAVRFINYFTNDTDCADIAGIERGIPISSDIRAYLDSSLDETSKEVADIVNYFSQEGKASAIMPPDPAVASQVRDLLSQYTEQVQYGLIDDYEAAAIEFMDEANAILAAQAE